MIKAIKVTGGNLNWESWEGPGEPPEDHVEIEVVWTAINRADLMQRAGVYPPRRARPFWGWKSAGALPRWDQG